MSDDVRPTITLRLTKEQVETLFAYMNVASTAVQDYNAGRWKPDPLDPLPLKYIGTLLQSASLGREMKQLHTWLKEQERGKP